MKLEIKDYRKLAEILDSNKSEFQLMVDVMEYLESKNLDLNDILDSLKEESKEGKLSLKFLFFSKLFLKLGLNELLDLAREI